MADIVTDLSVNNNWNVATGFNNTFTFTFIQNSVAFNTAGYTFSLQVRKFGSTTNLIALTQGSGITNGGATGIVTVVITAAQSATLTAGDYFWQLTVVHPDTFSYRWFNGTVHAFSELYTGDTVNSITATIDLNGSTVTATISITTIPKQIGVACSDETTALTAGTAKITFRMPFVMTLTAVRASLTTAQTSGNILTVDINDGGTTILSTKLTIDNTEKTSTTAVTAVVISDTALADNAEITIDIDQIGDGTAKGLKVWLIGV